MADDKKNDAKGQQGKAPESGQQAPDLSSNPTAIDAPDRTGGASSVATTTQDREAVTDLRPLDALPPSASAEQDVQAQVEAAMHEEYVQQEAQRRVTAARAQRLMDSVNTENPYGLKEGQKPVYQVGAFLCDPDGNRIQKVRDMPVAPREVIVDRATSMKQM